MMTPKCYLNPFTDKPVPPDRFIGRREIVSIIFSRLQNGDSTAIVGEPHIGKSSLLRFIADNKIQREHLGTSLEHYLFVDIDCHLIPPTFAPSDFWKQMLAKAEKVTTDPTLKRRCKTMIQDKCDSFALEDFFKSQIKSNLLVVLLIDEFDALLNHQNFVQTEFFGTLRSLSTHQIDLP